VKREPATGPRAGRRRGGKRRLESSCRKGGPRRGRGRGRVGGGVGGRDGGEGGVLDVGVGAADADGGGHQRGRRGRRGRERIVLGAREITGAGACFRRRVGRVGVGGMIAPVLPFPPSSRGEALVVLPLVVVVVEARMRRGRGVGTVACLASPCQAAAAAA